MARSPNGFTALELVVTIAIVAIGLSLAVPSLRDHLLNTRQKAAVTALHSDLQFARGQAVHLAARVVACPRSADDGCAATGRWESGWLVFHDANGDRQRQPGEALMRHAGAVEQLTIRSSMARRRLTFLPSGAAPGSNVTITVCDRRGAAHARALRVSNTGRVRRIAPPDNDGLDCG